MCCSGLRPRGCGVERFGLGSIGRSYKGSIGRSYDGWFGLGSIGRSYKVKSGWSGLV